MPCSHTATKLSMVVAVLFALARFRTPSSRRPHPQRERIMAEKKPMANELRSRCWKPRADGLCLLPRDHDGPHEFTCGDNLTAELNPLPVDRPTEGTE